MKDWAEMPSGILLVNKPCGMTSHDVVQVVRRQLGVRRIGHTGTLDPLAEGLLVLLVGAATKQQHAFQVHEKVYEATLRLGTQTDTGDAAGRVVQMAPIPSINEEQVREILGSFKGQIKQVPPAYSAVKVRGHPAYWWARRRQTVTLSPRTIHVSAIQLVCIEQDAIAFRVHCSAGTYVRTLAEAIAAQLGTVGHLTHLVRLRVGCWGIEDARPFEWVTRASADALSSALLPVIPPQPQHPA